MRAELGPFPGADGSGVRKHGLCSSDQTTGESYPWLSTVAYVREALLSHSEESQLLPLPHLDSQNQSNIPFFFFFLLHGMGFSYSPGIEPVLAEVQGLTTGPPGPVP